MFARENKESNVPPALGDDNDDDDDDDDEGGGRERHACMASAAATAAPPKQAACRWYLGVAPLLMPDEHEGPAIHAPNAAHYGPVVQARPVTMQLHKLVGDVQDDVQACGPVGVPCYLELLDGGQPAVGLPPQLQMTVTSLLLAHACLCRLGLVCSGT